MKTSGYCPKCDKYVELVPWPDGADGIVMGCCRCDNLMIYDDREDFIQREQDRYEDMVNCQHDYPYHTKHCSKCGMHRDAEPENYLSKQTKEAMRA